MTAVHHSGSEEALIRIDSGVTETDPEKNKLEEVEPEEDEPYIPAEDKPMLDESDILEDSKEPAPTSDIRIIFA
ncbi:hypothetical protein E2562_007085 [Oryza meyeriana var. granulata]|uniref:Uncharacterized protein n=1 Tax=Oryza meyeriana var. granulata TaxID=110450 RepID=A0A6G1F4V0_9ORYZ|nr:hypothetical protein E2562_007085 [Oryza meyeriana var. granulata]